MWNTLTIDFLKETIEDLCDLGLGKDSLGHQKCNPY